jgi:4-diphosphocytidyl-2-C-methyl-D-erythritol kinase
MIVFPNCKINLGLEILRKRPDGYHDLQTVFYPVDYSDILEFVEAPVFQFQTTGLQIGKDHSTNLSVKAYDLMKQRFPELPPIHMHLHKQIPMGAGLGGGSSDGAFTLKALNNHFGNGLSNEELISMSLQLGSDCPFFIINRPVLAHGRGEIMEPVDLDLSGYVLVMIHPGIHVSTKDAFAGIAPMETGTDLKNRISEPVEHWKNWLVNQFETSVGAKYPVILDIKNMLYNQGAVYASMSGSGSVVFGLFRQAPNIKTSPGWKLIKVSLK